MNLKKLERQIKTTLDNLSSVNMSNTLKSQAIMKVVEEFLEEVDMIDYNPFVAQREHKYDTN